MSKRSNQTASSRRADANRIREDETAEPSGMSDNQLWAAIYRLGGRNQDGRFTGRIQNLCAEQSRRRELRNGAGK